MYSANHHILYQTIEEYLKGCILSTFATSAWCVQITSQIPRWYLLSLCLLAWYPSSSMQCSCLWSELVEQISIYSQLIENWIHFKENDSLSMFCELLIASRKPENLLSNQAPEWWWNWPGSLLFMRSMLSHSRNKNEVHMTAINAFYIATPHLPP